MAWTAGSAPTARSGGGIGGDQGQQIGVGVDDRVVAANEAVGGALRLGAGRRRQAQRRDQAPYRCAHRRPPKLPTVMHRGGITEKLENMKNGAAPPWDRPSRSPPVSPERLVAVLDAR